MWYRRPVRKCRSAATRGRPGAQLPGVDVRHHHGGSPRHCTYDARHKNRNERRCQPVTNVLVSTPAASGMDPYGGGPSDYANDPYGADAYANAENLYAEDLTNEHVCSPYYEADPVQFAYTPADIAPRAPVVRPDRTTLVSLILSSQARVPIFILGASPSTPDKPAEIAPWVGSLFPYRPGSK